jgi:hypothetical protein
MDADKKPPLPFILSFRLLVGGLACWSTEIRVKMHFPGRAFLVTDTADIPKVLRGFLTAVVGR